MSLKIEQLPAFADNYLYLITCTLSGKVAAVDPGDADIIIEALEKDGRTLDLILNTHHHMDHIGGNEKLVEKYGCYVIGSDVDEERGVIPGLQRGVKDGEIIKLGKCMGEVIAVPGHTKGHIAYWFEEFDALFCGDTLFCGGCGRLFEGTPEDMYASLWKLKSLPLETRVYCAHEYTRKNLEFAMQTAPDEPAYRERYGRVAKIVDAGHFSVPGTIAEELETNIFLRAETPEELAELRRLKDDF